MVQPNGDPNGAFVMGKGKGKGKFKGNGKVGKQAPSLPKGHRQHFKLDGSTGRSEGPISFVRGSDDPNQSAYLKRPADGLLATPKAKARRLGAEEAPPTIGLLAPPDEQEAGT